MLELMLRRRLEMDEQDTDLVGCRVYSYGCGKLSKEARQAIDNQLWLAYQYRFQLWNLSIAARNAYREIRAQIIPDLVDTEVKLKQAKELILILSDKELTAKERNINKKSLFLAKVAKEQYQAKLNKLRLEAKTNQSMTDAVNLINYRRNELLKALRKVFSSILGLYWGTYSKIEADARMAESGREDPVRPTWKQSGVLVCQLRGVTTSDVLSGKNTCVRIQPITREGKSKLVGSRTTAQYRIASNKSAPVWVDLPIMYHRDLPVDADIKYVKLVVKKLREGRFHYSLQFTLKSSFVVKTGLGAGVAAICFANDKATVQCEYGPCLELDIGLDQGIVSKIKDLQAIRQKQAIAAIGLLNGWCDRQDELPEWVLGEIEATKTSLSCRKLYHLRNRLRHLIDARVMEHLDKWAYKENHLYWWQYDARINMLRNRSDRYKCIAADLRRKYRNILVDSRKLDLPKRKTAARNDLAIHDLKTHIHNAFGSTAIKVTGESCKAMLTKWRESTKQE
jgi:hypothetical protein